MHQFLISAFWAAASLTLYTYIGYPLWAYLRALLWPRPWRQEPILPTVSVILAVHNGSALLPGKIKQLQSLDYPKDRIEFIVVSDGSTDGTNRILKENPHMRSIVCAERRGKAAALNLGMRCASGEILLFSDIRPRLESGSLRILVSNFADPNVGCVAGDVLLLDDGHDHVARAVGGLYWRYEQQIRKWEATAGSLLGVYGGFYAVRRELACALPESAVLDDMLQPLHIVRQGYRSVLDSRALVYDVWPRNVRDEFHRKVRTLAGNFQLLALAPWLLTSANRIRFEFVSHKLLRLVVPALLLVLLSTSTVLATHSRLYGALLVCQLLTYLVAAVGVWCGLPILVRASGAARAFCLMNVAVIIGLYKFLFTRGPLWTIWTPTATFCAGASNENVEAPPQTLRANLIGALHGSQADESES